MNKRIIAVGLLVAAILALLGWRAAAVEGQTPIPDGTTRQEQTVTVVTQKQIVPLGCMHLTGALLQVRQRAVLDAEEGIRTPWTAWRTVRVLEYYSNPNFPACQG